MKILVTGAGGFIGHHLVSFLKSQGHFVRGVDLKYPQFEATQADEFLTCDLTQMSNCLQATQGINHIYALAADMGGMGYLSANQALTMHTNSQIDLNTLEAARINRCQRLLYSSSACIYPEHLQLAPEIQGLKEEDAYPACPPDAYGWAKLFTERLCQYYSQDYGIETRIARFHNIFGPLGTWEGGREKAPAALCRKIAWAEMEGNREVEIWGDGLQTRSFCYIDDCVTGLNALMSSNYPEPLNLGQDRMVTINELATLIADIAGIEIQLQHVSGPQGVRGRNSDNSRTESILNWLPRVSLEEGLAKTYQWIRGEVRAKYAAAAR